MAKRPNIECVSTFSRSIQRRLLPTLAFLLTLLFLTGAGLLWQQQREHLEDRVTMSGEEVGRYLREGLEVQANGLAAMAQLIAMDVRVGQALLQEDSDRLLADWLAESEILNSEFSITHFYFWNANREALIRLYNPNRRGGTNTRFTALEAERTGQTSSGIELGSLGTFTLRVVHPVYVDQILLGYVELGKEIEDVLQALHHHRSDIEIAVSVRKALLKRDAWEAGMRLLDRKTDWNNLTGNVVIYCSQDILPKAFSSLADHDQTGKRAHGVSNEAKDVKGRVWRAVSFPLTDASSKEVGKLLVMHDITSLQATFKKNILIGGLFGTILLTALLVLVFVMLRRVDSNVLMQQSQLLESEQYLAATLHSIGDGVIACNKDGFVTNLNGVAEILTGWKATEASGRPLEEISHVVHTQTKEPVENSVLRVLAEGVSVQLAQHTTLIARNNQEHQIADKCAPIQDSTGTILGAVLVFQDVTRQYRQHENDRFDLQFRKLVAEASASFLQARDVQTFDRAIDEVLAELGSLFEVDRSYLFRLSDDMTTMDNTHECCAPGIIAQKDRIQQFPTNFLPMVVGTLRAGKTLQIPEVDALSPEAKSEKKEFQAQGIQSLLCLPFCDSQGRLIAFLGFDIVRMTFAWPEEQVSMLKGSVATDNSYHKNTNS